MTIWSFIFSSVLIESNHKSINPSQAAFYRLSRWILHCQMLHMCWCWNLTQQQDPLQPETQNYCDIQIAINLSFNINITFGHLKITFGIFKRYEILRTQCTTIHLGIWVTDSVQRTNCTNLTQVCEQYSNGSVHLTTHGFYMLGSLWYD